MGRNNAILRHCIPTAGAYSGRRAGGRGIVGGILGIPDVGRNGRIVVAEGVDGDAGKGDLVLAVGVGEALFTERAAVMLDVARGRTVGLLGGNQLDEACMLTVVGSFFRMGIAQVDVEALAGVDIFAGADPAALVAICSFVPAHDLPSGELIALGRVGRGGGTGGHPGAVGVETGGVLPESELRIAVKVAGLDAVAVLVLIVFVLVGDVLDVDAVAIGHDFSPLGVEVNFLIDPGTVLLLVRVVAAGLNQVALCIDRDAGIVGDFVLRVFAIEVAVLTACENGIEIVGVLIVGI